MRGIVLNNVSIRNTVVHKFFDGGFAYDCYYCRTWKPNVMQNNTITTRTSPRGIGWRRRRPYFQPIVKNVPSQASQPLDF